MVRIHVTAYGDLRRYIPADQRDSGAALVLPAGATIMQMLDALRLPYQNTWLIGVNDSVVQLDHPLHDGDRVELMMPIGGGARPPRRCTVKPLADPAPGVNDAD